MEAAAGGRPRTGFARWAALAGAVYVVLFVVGTIAAPNPATAYGAIASGGLACLVCSLDWYLRVVGEDRFHKDLRQWEAVVG